MTVIKAVVSALSVEPDVSSCKKVTTAKKTRLNSNRTDENCLNQLSYILVRDMMKKETRHIPRNMLEWISGVVASNMPTLIAIPVLRNKKVRMNSKTAFLFPDRSMYSYSTLGLHF